MKSIGTTSLPEDAYISEPVFLDSSYILLSPEIPVKKELISRLKEWGFSQVFSDGVPMAEAKSKMPQTRSPDADVHSPVSQGMVSDATDGKESDETELFYRSTVEFLGDVFKKYRETNTISLPELTEKVKEIIAYTKNHKNHVLRLSHLSEDAANYLASHSVKTTFLTLVIGDQFKLPPFRMIELGIAGLLHEIGMIKLPEHVYLSNQPLGPQERKAIVAHTILGYKILKALSFQESVCAAVLEHHERIDGNGYPQRLAGDKITLYAKILAVACSYDAIISSRPFRPGKEEHASMLNILREVGKQFDEAVIKALLMNLSLYPLGSYVLLSNGARGQVAEADPRNPKYPTVKILVNEAGVRLTECPLLMTNEAAGISISRPLTKEEIAAIA